MYGGLKFHNKYNEAFSERSNDVKYHSLSRSLFNLTLTSEDNVRKNDDLSSSSRVSAKLFADGKSLASSHDPSMRTPATAKAVKP